MVSGSKFLYKIHLKTAADVFDFIRTAVKYKGDISLVNGKHRLNAKSSLGVALARVSWDEIYLESEEDCYFDFEKFIV